MKYLKKLFESNIPQNLEDNFLGISDVLGEPESTDYVSGGCKHYTLKWNINPGLFIHDDIEKFIKQVKVLASFEHDLLSAKARLPNFVIKMGIIPSRDNDSEKLHLTLKEKRVPSDKDFIKYIDMNKLVIHISKKRIEEALASYGHPVSKLEISPNHEILNIHFKDPLVFPKGLRDHQNFGFSKFIMDLRDEFMYYEELGGNVVTEVKIDYGLRQKFPNLPIQFLHRVIYDDVPYGMDYSEVPDKMPFKIMLV